MDPIYEDKSASFKIANPFLQKIGVTEISVSYEIKIIP